ncbi:hypothetical protein FN960_12200 [Alkalicoccobacillus porphyridii]|uniref:Uncharacterized protein n=2 Tax=Alkalicoccobacillus porphyridii TaxID=2597270 RepID=A0A553ZXE1_9BACI|nr:hypothetical protein FN960_12200 [Alkalicoccobacillus porphyridii]
MTRITATPSLRMHRVLQHRIQNAVRPSAVTSVEPVSPTARTTESAANESANYLYEYERSSWVSSFKRTLQTFYTKERRLWTSISEKQKGILQFERFIDAWNETINQVNKLESLGMTHQSKLRSYLYEQQDLLHSIGVNVQDLKLVLSKPTLTKVVNNNEDAISSMQKVKHSLHEAYHQLFFISFPEPESPYDQQPADVKGLIIEQHG